MALRQYSSVPALGLRDSERGHGPACGPALRTATRLTGNVMGVTESDRRGSCTPPKMSFAFFTLACHYAASPTLSDDPALFKVPFGLPTCKRLTSTTRLAPTRPNFAVAISALPPAAHRLDVFVLKLDTPPLPLVTPTWA